MFQSRRATAEPVSASELVVRVDLAKDQRRMREQFKEAMRGILKDIQSGEYAKSFLLENTVGAPTLLSKRRLLASHQLEQVGGEPAHQLAGTVAVIEVKA